MLFQEKLFLSGFSEVLPDEDSVGLFLRHLIVVNTHHIKFIILIFFSLFGPTVACGTSPIRDQTCAPCSGSRVLTIGPPTKLVPLIIFKCTVQWH